VKCGQVALGEDVLVRLGGAWYRPVKLSVDVLVGLLGVRCCVVSPSTVWLSSVWMIW